MFSCSTDKTIRLWDVQTGVCIRKFKGHTSFVNSCQPARRGPQLICSGSDDGTVRIWDQRKKDAVNKFECTYQVTSVTFNDTSEQILSGGIDNDIKVNLIGPKFVQKLGSYLVLSFLGLGFTKRGSRLQIART